MTTQSYKLPISQSIGEVSAELVTVENPVAIFTLAHGAGAGMHHTFMTALAKELAMQNINTLRFNFPFTENKKGRPDLPAVAHKTIECAIEKAHSLFPVLPLYAAGKSFGGRMSSQFLAANHRPFVNGIVFYGFPLHPAGKPSTDRAEHLKNLTLPKLFLQGTRDELASWDLIESVAKNLSSSTLIKMEGADHSFKKGKENLIPGLAKATAQWVASTK